MLAFLGALCVQLDVGRYREKGDGAAGKDGLGFCSVLLYSSCSGVRIKAFTLAFLLLLHRKIVLMRRFVKILL